MRQTAKRVNYSVRSKFVDELRITCHTGNGPRYFLSAKRDMVWSVAKRNCMNELFSRLDYHVFGRSNRNLSLKIV